MEEHKSVFRVRSMCAALGVSRSGYYEWLNRRPSPRAEDNQRLLTRIQQIHRRNQGVRVLDTAVFEIARFYGHHHAAFSQSVAPAHPRSGRETADVR